MQAVLTREWCPGRAHSFLAYCVALGSFAWGWTRAGPVPVEQWLGFLLMPGPGLSCVENVGLASRLGAGMWVMHFLRRLGEVLFVHNYKRKASWAHLVFATTSYVLYGTVVSSTVREDAMRVRVRGDGSGPCDPMERLVLAFGAACFLVGQAGNCYSHFQLKWATDPSPSLRADKDTTTATTSWGKAEGKKIIRGGLFNYVTAAHFTYEIVTWYGFMLATGRSAGGTMMFVWSLGGLILMARERHANYQRYFDGREGREKYPEGLRAIIPFVL